MIGFLMRLRLAWAALTRAELVCDLPAGDVRRLEWLLQTTYDPDQLDPEHWTVTRQARVFIPSVERFGRQGEHRETVVLLPVLPGRERVVVLRW